MATGGRHAAGRASGRRLASARPTAQVVALGLGGLCAVVAWAVLVWLAIEAGRTARSGEPEAWRRLGFASAAAVACLVLALALLGRLRGRPVSGPGRRVRR